MRIRCARAVAVGGVAAALLLTAGGAVAAPTTMSDPRGDALTGGGCSDIVSVSFATTKLTTTKVVNGRKVVTSVPKDVVISMKLAAKPVIDATTSYQVQATTACGTLFVYSHWAVTETLHRFWFDGCGPASATGGGSFLDDYVKVRVVGTTISWTVPFSRLPKQLKVGSVFKELLAYTAPADPLSGTSTADQFGEFGSDDWVDSAQTYKLGA